jgi:hypothetical protein
MQLATAKKGNTELEARLVETRTALQSVVKEKTRAQSMFVFFSLVTQDVYIIDVCVIFVCFVSVYCICMRTRNTAQQKCLFFYIYMHAHTSAAEKEALREVKTQKSIVVAQV